MLLKNSKPKQPTIFGHLKQPTIFGPTVLAHFALLLLPTTSKPTKNKLPLEASSVTVVGHSFSPGQLTCKQAPACRSIWAAHLPGHSNVFLLLAPKVSVAPTKSSRAVGEVTIQWVLASKVNCAPWQLLFRQYTSPGVQEREIKREQWLVYIYVICNDISATNTLAGQKLCLLTRPTAKPFPRRILLSTWFWSISTPEKLFSLLNLKRGDNWPCHTCHAKWTW